MPPHSPHIQVQNFRGATVACQVMGDRPFFLHGPVNAGQIMGAQWFANLLAELRCDFPAARIFGVLDCQNHTGQALMALECGISHILVGTLAQTPFDALGQIATQRGCHIWRGISLMPETDPSDGLLPAFSLFVMDDHYLPASECKKRLLAHLAQQ